MPSTPLAYPQVVSRTFARRNLAFLQFKPFYAPSSIPGSSTFGHLCVLLEPTLNVAGTVSSSLANEQERGSREHDGGGEAVDSPGD
jgi:hypothetical protein